MPKKRNDIFWISYSDLLTSLFFIMMVLFAISYFKYNQNVKNLKQKLEVFQMVEENLRPLKSDDKTFKYEPDFKRFVLTEEVKFNVSKTNISPTDIVDYDKKSVFLLEAGKSLLNTINAIAENRKNNSALKDVSYLVIISGYASKLPVANQKEDYTLSYDRAYNLWQFWKNNGINFEDTKYKDFVDLQISGNGWGGMGRIPSNNPIEEMRNQRFIIQIIPKTKNIE